MIKSKHLCQRAGARHRYGFTAYFSNTARPETLAGAPSLQEQWAALCWCIWIGTGFLLEADASFSAVRLTLEPLGRGERERQKDRERGGGGTKER